MRIKQQLGCRKHSETWEKRVWLYACACMCGCWRKKQRYLCKEVSVLCLPFSCGTKQLHHIVFFYRVETQHEQVGRQSNELWLIQILKDWFCLVFWFF